MPATACNNSGSFLYVQVSGKPSPTVLLPGIIMHGWPDSGRGKKKTGMATIQLTAEGFREKVFDYTKDQEWMYNGSLPAIVDFYADWCGPCKAVAPVLEELSNEYEGRLLIYKIDTDKEEELSTLFGIQSIPTLLFIPVEGSPMMQKGAIPKNAFQQVIEERLLTTAGKES
jgi:thioredoxin